MRTAGLAMTDVWAGRVQRDGAAQTRVVEALSAELIVLAQSLELKHHGPEINYRPYLHLSGELRAVRPASPLPCGITEVAYTPGIGELVDAFYEFDDEQLVELTKKGYFNTGFLAPDNLTGIEWELPATIDAMVVLPDRGAAPVVFVQVRDIASLDVDQANSGYDLAAYFEDRTRQAGRPEPQVVDQQGLRVRAAAINSLFSDEDYQVVEPTRYLVQRPVEEKPGGLDVSDAEQSIAARRAEFEAECIAREGTTDNLFHRRVAWALHADDVTVQMPRLAPRKEASLPFSARRAINFDEEPTTFTRVAP